MLSDMTNELTTEQQAHLDALIAALQAMPSCDGLFSPYASATGSYAADSKDEVGEVADRIRTDNFRKYATALLLAGTDVILCGEAPGWAGCRHSGIAFSDEKRIAAQAFPFTGCELLPLAAAGQRPLLEEQSARIVWGGIERAVRAPLLFNAVQLHPHQPGVALTNRTPKPAEVELGKESLDRLIELVQPRLVVAVGRTAEKALALLGHEAAHVRHPARGGKNDFLRGLEELGVIAPAAPPPQQSLF
jgi:uracil-DNA glycosylase